VGPVYGVLDLPDPGAAIYAQAGGAFAVAFGYLLWIAPRDGTLTRVVAAGSALATLLLVLGGVAWIVEMGSEAAGHHTLLAAVALPTLAVLGLAEAAIASRRVAILLPSDQPLG
jgi:hypothetical protein